MTTIEADYIFVNANMKAELNELQTLFSALADTTRLRIIGLLAKGEICVCDIHETLSITQPKASRHLAYLRRAGLVVTEKRGLWVHYRLADGIGAGDAVLRTVRETLRSLDDVKRDVERLEQTLCCAPTQPLRVKRR
jgi:ArsR family transcriptional regulator